VPVPLLLLITIPGYSAPPVSAGLERVVALVHAVLDALDGDVGVREDHDEAPHEVPDRLEHQALPAAASRQVDKYTISMVCLPTPAYR
jgi:hypothetical protein